MRQFSSLYYVPGGSLTGCLDESENACQVLGEDKVRSSKQYVNSVLRLRNNSFYIGYAMYSKLDKGLSENKEKVLDFEDARNRWAISEMVAKGKRDERCRALLLFVEEPRRSRLSVVGLW